MATSGQVVLICALVLLPYGGSGASLHSQKESERLIRKEKNVQVELNPNGDMMLKESNEAELKVQFCDYDFVLGTPASDKCLDSNHTRVLEKSMCIEAGRRSGAKTDHVGFVKEQDDGYHYPKGCFKDACSKTDSSACYFYNPREDTAKDDGNITMAGTILCSRVMYVFGTPDSNDGCPDGYKTIDNETTCLGTAGCMGEAPAPVFRVGVRNESQHMDFPRECFSDREGLNGEGKNKVTFNAPSNLTNADGWGTSVHGVQICEVIETMNWRSGSTTDESQPETPH